MGDNPKSERSADNMRRLYQLGFQKARELLQGGEPSDWEDKEAKERYWAYLPGMAMDMMRYIAQEANMIEQASDDTFNRSHVGLERFMDQMASTDFAVKVS